MRVYRCVLGQGTGSFLGNLFEYQFLRVKEYSFGVSLQFIRAYIIFQNNLHEEELEENRLIMRLIIITSNYVNATQLNYAY